MRKIYETIASLSHIATTVALFYGCLLRHCCFELSKLGGQAPKQFLKTASIGQSRNKVEHRHRMGLKS